MGMRRVKKVWDKSLINTNGEIDLSKVEGTVTYNYINIMNELQKINETGKNDEDTLEDAKSLVLMAINTSDCSDAYRTVRVRKINKFTKVSDIVDFVEESIENGKHYIPKDPDHDKNFVCYEEYTKKENKDKEKK